MTARLRPALVWVLLAGLVLAVLAAASTARPAAAAEQTSALSQVGGCIAGGGRGEVLLVIDTSQSLERNDPDAVRVDAAEYLVRQLASFAQSSGADIDVAVAGFATGYDPGKSWTRLTGDGQAVIEGLQPYRERTDGMDTDYWRAVAASRAVLNERTAELKPATTCPVWFWFSDGEYDIDKRSSADQLASTGGPKPYAPENQLDSDQAVEAAMAVGRNDLCRAGGQADQTRTAGITTIAIGLQHSGADFSLMKGIATGAPGLAGASGCGEQAGLGQFILADQLDDIFFAFDQFATPSQPPSAGTGTVCGRTPCPAGTFRFTVDSSIKQLQLLASSDVPGQELTLTGPDGAAHQLSSSDGSLGVAGAQVSWHWLSKQTVQLSATRPAGDWGGAWKLVFTNPQSDTQGGTWRTSLHLLSDLLPAWSDAPQSLIRAADQQFTFAVQRDGKDVDAADVPSTLRLSGTLKAADQATLTVADSVPNAQIGTPVSADLSRAAIGPGSLQLTLQITTAAATAPDGTQVPGTALAPRTVSLATQVRAAPEYPTLPATLNFGSTESADPVTAELPVTGKGCVWLGSVDKPTTSPEQVTAGLSSPADSQQNCTAGPLEVTLTPSGTGNGLLSGTATVQVAPGSGTGEPVSVPVRYQLEMRKPVNQPLRLAVFLVVLAIGVLLPVAALYLIKWWSARMPATTVFFTRQRGRVVHGDSFLDHARPLRLADMASVVITGSRRSLDVAGARLRTRTGLWPTEPGYVRVDLGRPAESSGPVARVGRYARLPLDIRNHWIVSVDPVDPIEGPVEVLYLVSGTDQLAELEAAARREVPGTVAELRGALHDSGAAAGTAGIGVDSAPDEWDAPAPVTDPLAATGAGWESAPTGSPPTGQGSPQTGQGWLPRPGAAPPQTAPPQPPRPRPPDDDGW